MSFTIVNKDILEALESGEIDQMLHVVNCRGVMGRGLALQVKLNNPRLFHSYKEKCEKYSKEPQNLLGAVQGFNGMINLFAQLNYGTDKRQLSYWALKDCLDKVVARFPKEIKIGVPYNMGCGLAGGDWDKVEEIISCILKDHQVIYYKID